MTTVAPSVRPESAPIRRPQVEAPARPAAGLCVTCVHVAGCGLRIRSESGVWHCEEFDCGSMPTPTATAFVEQAPRAVPDTALGLCANCANAATCGLARSPGGVWHCEEYA